MFVSERANLQDRVKRECWEIGVRLFWRATIFFIDQDHLRFDTRALWSCAADEAERVDSVGHWDGDMMTGLPPTLPGTCSITSQPVQSMFVLLFSVYQNRCSGRTHETSGCAPRPQPPVRIESISECNGSWQPLHLWDLGAGRVGP
jgi:hypothetical protein